MCYAFPLALHFLGRAFRGLGLLQESRFSSSSSSSSSSLDDFLKKRNVIVADFFFFFCE
jgi:hypothetical protein